MGKENSKLDFGYVAEELKRVGETKHDLHKRLVVIESEQWILLCREYLAKPKDIELVYMEAKETLCENERIVRIYDKEMNYWEIYKSDLF